MNKIIPILPCCDINAQGAFYKNIGFELVGKYVAPVNYLVTEFDGVELHFWLNKKMEPEHNAAMIFLRADDLDKFYETFTSGLKNNLGKIPRSGIPRISKIRDLKEDRRFTLVDPAGNTLYVGTPNAGNEIFLRTLNSKDAAKNFAVLYDIVYSKEDCETGKKVLQKLLETKDALDDMDKAKLLLVSAEIQKELNEKIDGGELKKLIGKNKGAQWETIKKKYDEIMSDDKAD